MPRVLTLLLALALPALLPAEVEDPTIRRPVFDGMRLSLEQAHAEAADRFATALERFDAARAEDPVLEATMLRGLFSSASKAERWDVAARAGRRLRTLEGYTPGTATPDALEHLAALARVHLERGEGARAAALHEEAVEAARAAPEVDRGLQLAVLGRAREAMAAAGDWERALRFGERHLALLRASPESGAVGVGHLLQTLAREVLAPAGRLEDALRLARESEALLRACDREGEMACAVALISTEELLLRLLQETDRDAEVDALLDRIRARGKDAVALVEVTTDPPGARVHNLVRRTREATRGAYLGSTRRPLKLVQTALSPAQLWIEFDGLDEPVHHEARVRSVVETPVNRLHLSLEEARAAVEARRAREAAEEAARAAEEARLAREARRRARRKRERMGGG